MLFFFLVFQIDITKKDVGLKVTKRRSYKIFGVGRITVYRRGGEGGVRSAGEGNLTTVWLWLCIEKPFGERGSH